MHETNCYSTWIMARVRGPGSGLTLRPGLVRRLDLTQSGLCTPFVPGFALQFEEGGGIQRVSDIDLNCLSY